MRVPRPLPYMENRDMLTPVAFLRKYPRNTIFVLPCPHLEILAIVEEGHLKEKRGINSTALRGIFVQVITHR